MRARSASAAAALAALAALVRWPNAALSALGVLLGAWWVGWTVPHAGAIAVAALAAMPLAAAANAWNDAADADIDRVAHPDRPIPAGRITPRAARRIATGAALAGVLLSAAATPALGALSIGVVALMFAYSPWLKRGGVAGNLVVAILASLPFLYGGWAAGNATAALPLVCIAVPLHLAREIAKDLDDATADALTRRTLPLTIGARAAAAIVVAALLTFVAAVAPYVAARPVFALALGPALVLLARGAWLTLRARRGSPRVLKLAMVWAMIALVVARP